MAPKAIENSAATTDAPEKARTPNKAESMSGLEGRTQCAANRASAATAPTKATSVAAEPQPQSLPLTKPSVSAPVPSVIRAVPSASGRGTAPHGEEFRWLPTANFCIFNKLKLY